MGLDTTHGAWHGSYSGFGIWRQRIAEAAGIIEPGQKLYNGFLPEEEELDLCPIDWAFWDTQTDYRGRWKEDPEDVIWVLLAHSDCDGHIKKRFLLLLAERLEPLAEEVDADLRERGFISRPTNRFVSGLRCAAAAGEKLRFH